MFLKAGAAPEITVAVSIVISQICLFARLFMLRGMIGLPAGDFIRKVYLNVMAVSSVSLALPLMICRLLPEGFWGFATSVAVCVLSATLSVSFIGLSRSERREIVSMIKERI